jgi:hypothetical protein
MNLIALQHVAEEVSAVTEICHYKQHVIPFPDFSDVQDVWVVKSGENLVLTHKSRHVGYLFSLDNFDGDALKRELVAGAVHNSEATLTDLLLKEVGFLDVSAARLQEHLLVDNQCLDHLVEIVFRAGTRTLLL